MRASLVLVTLLALQGVACVQPSRLPEAPIVARLGEWSRNESSSLDALGVETFRIIAGPGVLNITGIDNAPQLVVEARITSRAGDFAEAERIAKEVHLEWGARNTENPELRVTEPRITDIAKQSYVADLTIGLPPRVRVVIVDGEGSLSVEHLGAGLEVRNQAGSVEITDVQGGLEVVNQGRPCKIRRASGAIYVVDGGGDVEISEITGNINVQDDGGTLSVGFVTGDVTTRGRSNLVEILNIEGDAVVYDVAHQNTRIEGISGKLLFTSSAADPKPPTPR